MVMMIILKIKIEIFKVSIITNFHNKKVPEENIPYKLLSIIVLDSIIKTDNKYYPQTFLDECVYKQQKQNNIRIILLKKNYNQIVTLIMNQNQNQITILMMIKQYLILTMLNKFRKK